MRAIATPGGLPISDPAALVDVEVEAPQALPHDLVVRVEAVSVNPVDSKVRLSANPSDTPRILGYDAAGTVTAVGQEVSGFAVGDEVYYAGAIDRPGSNADYQAVDHRIAAHKPTTLSFADAAALPLTALTAMEALEDLFHVGANSEGTLLVLGGAGGVGSIMIQLAKRLTSLRVIATASRPETAAWAREMGADEVANHHDLGAEVLRIVPEGVDYVLSTHSEGQIGAFAEIVKPLGHIAAIDDGNLNLSPLKPKRISWHWEFMFSRSLFQTPDIAVQGRMLADLATMVDAGEIRTTATQYIEDFTAAGIREAHRRIESHGTQGKIVVTR
ncbi:zinc-binding alcohol dehydrogenase family protein [Demequina aurantiaca]|uniref:zinc-binding alcohol dehydrogenase family protein n=1 Tax=Demequina aurantiaca TaxID=676200 RepID=UPI003D3448FB